MVKVALVINNDIKKNIMNILIIHPALMADYIVSKVKPYFNISYFN